MFPKQTNKMAKGVLGMMIGCCRVFSMLARIALMICVVCLGVSPAFSEESLAPHVIVIVNDGGGKALALDDVLKGWNVVKGDLRVSPSRAATSAAIMYGRSALQSGVVSDLGWRSRPVASDSFFHLYKSEEKESIAHWGEDEVENVLLGDDPITAIIQQGGEYDSGFLLGFLKECFQNHTQKDTRPVVVMYVTMDDAVDRAKRGMGVDEYHYPATWQVFQHGLDIDIEGLHVDYQINEVIKKVIDGDREISVIPTKYHFFHRANWPAEDTTEKYRHRDSLVVGDGFALVDGLSLYRSNDSFEPDLSKPLDITAHSRIHSEMLLAHSQWWGGAKDALDSKRSITVRGITKLTVKDWSGSNIVYQGDGAPSLKPIVAREDLLGLLKGLKDPQYKERVPPYSGSWSVKLTEAGRYKITARLLPEVLGAELSKLEAGRAFVQLGPNKAQLSVQKGTTSVSVKLDSEAGVFDLECWFIGQLALERELGAFYVEIERVGDKKYKIPIGH